MKILENTKKYIGEKAILRKVRLNTRSVKSCNLKEAKSVGIVFDATHVVCFDVIKSFTKQLTDIGIKVSALGYVQDKKLIDHYLYRKGFLFFTNAQLNWYSRPYGNDVNGFIKKPFDILFNLSLQSNYPIDYIVASSMAAFKTGRFIQKANYLDLTIDFDLKNSPLKDIQNDISDINTKISFTPFTEKNVESQLNYLIEQLMHYLNSLNQKPMKIVSPV
ncbi:MAG: hypothetical protein MI922_20110 [Bacteroidales bacterium]|nr:hypothetical protein [Bacteroidales bacterium]